MGMAYFDSKFGTSKAQQTEGFRLYGPGVRFVSSTRDGDGQRQRTSEVRQTKENRRSA